MTNCSDTAYEYNSSDRLTLSPFASSYDWDDQNNRPGRLKDTSGTPGFPSMDYQYDARDHTTVIDDGTTEVEETLAPSGRVVRRKVSDTVPSPDVVTEDLVYGYADGGDSPAYVRDMFADDWNTGTGSGIGWNSTSWNTSSTTSTKKLDVQGNEGAIWVDGTSADGAAVTKHRENAEGALTYRFASNTVGSELRVGLRSTGSSSPNNESYRVDIKANSTTIRIRKKVWGASSAVDLTSFTYTANTNTTPDKIRFWATNNGASVQLQVRLWEGATEPTTWNKEWTDSTADRILGAGTIQIAHSTSTGAPNTAYIDNITFTDATGPATTTYIQGPHGLLVTDTAGTPTYQLVNPRGDIVGTTDSAGAFSPAPTTTEFGSPSTTPSSRLGWLGGQQRFTTHAPSKTMRMGLRIYDPAVGRFTTNDPVEGGSANAFDYAAGDPVNAFDLDGRSVQGGRNPVATLDPSGPPLNPRTPSLRDAYAESLRARGLPADYGSRSNWRFGCVGLRAYVGVSGVTGAMKLIGTSSEFAPNFWAFAGYLTAYGAGELAILTFCE